MISDLKQAIESLKVPDRPAIIGLSGFSGSGKSSLALSLAAELSGTQVLESDVFWRPDSNHLSDEWLAIDRHSIRKDVLIPARAGRPVAFRPWNWEEKRLDDAVVLPQCERILLEGIGIFHPDLTNLFDLRIWVDAPFDASMENGMRRDRETYGLTNDAEWREVWIPNERAYFERFRPDRMADLVVPWFGG